MPKSYFRCIKCHRDLPEEEMGYMVGINMRDVRTGMCKSCIKADTEYDDDEAVPDA